jgi:hypothetical protein
LRNKINATLSSISTGIADKQKKMNDAVMKEMNEVISLRRMRMMTLNSD